MMNDILFKWILSAIAAICIITGTNSALAVEIDVLVLYDDYTEGRLRGEPSVRMKSWQDQINTIYRNSGVDLQMRIVSVEKYNAPGNRMTDVLNHNRTSQEVAKMRSRVGADFVTQLHRVARCGIGYGAVNSRYAFNVVGALCGPASMAHELGHNMGLTHSRVQGDRGGSWDGYKYGLGYWDTEHRFGTIMTYAQQYGQKWLPLFSDPKKTYNGHPLGIPAGQSGEADATRAINNVKHKLAKFKETVIPTNAADQNRNDSGGETVSDTDTNALQYEKPSNSTGNLGPYYIKAKSSGNCLGLQRKWFYNDIVQWNCTQATNQQWEVETFKKGYARLQSVDTDACMTVIFSRTTPDANVIQFNCSDSPGQKWIVAKKDTNTYQIKNQNSGLCLDAGTDGNGTSVVQNTCGDSASQLFSFSPVSSSLY